MDLRLSWLLATATLQLMLGCSNVANLSSLPNSTDKKISIPGPTTQNSDSAPSKDGDGSGQAKNPTTSEVVTPPSLVTGALLVCMEAPNSGSVPLEATVYCSFKVNDVLVDLKAAFSSYQWAIEGEANVQISELLPASGAHVAFSFSAGSQVELQNILSEVVFVLNARDKNGIDQHYGEPLTVASTGLSGGGTTPVDQIPVETIPPAASPAPASAPTSSSSLIPLLSSASVSTPTSSPTPNSGTPIGGGSSPAIGGVGGGSPAGGGFGGGSPAGGGGGFGGGGGR